MKQAEKIHADLKAKERNLIDEFSRRKRINLGSGYSELVKINLDVRENSEV